MIFGHNTVQIYHISRQQCLKSPEMLILCEAGQNDLQKCPSLTKFLPKCNVIFCTTSLQSNIPSIILRSYLEPQENSWWEHWATQFSIQAWTLFIVHWKAFWWIKEPTLVPTLCFFSLIMHFVFFILYFEELLRCRSSSFVSWFFHFVFRFFYFSTFQNCWAAWEPEFHHPPTFHLLSMHFSFLYNLSLKKYSKFTHSGLQEEKKLRKTLKLK